MPSIKHDFIKETLASSEERASPLFIMQYLKSSTTGRYNHFFVAIVIQLLNKIKGLKKWIRPSRRRKMVTIMKNFFDTITIEPVVFLFQFGVFINKGSQLTTNLVGNLLFHLFFQDIHMKLFFPFQIFKLIWKVCRIKMNYTEEVCDHLTDEANSDIQIEVLKNVNQFLLTSQLLVI